MLTSSLIIRVHYFRLSTEKLEHWQKYAGIYVYQGDETIGRALPSNKDTCLPRT